MKKVICSILKKMIVGIAVVVIGVFVVPLCLLLGMIAAIWSAAEAAIGYLE